MEIVVTYRSLMLAASIAGLVAGLALFALVYAFREAFLAQDQWNFQSNRGGAEGFTIMCSVAIGCLFSWANSRFSGFDGRSLAVPLVLFVAVAVGLAIVLEYQVSPELVSTLTPRIVLAGGVIAVAACATEWFRG